MSEWSPSTEDIRLGQEAYIHYLGGIAILNAPHSSFALGAIGEGVEQPEAMVVQSEGLMYRGLRGVIAYANPPQLRSDLQKYAEHGYETALPHMRGIVDSAYEKQTARIHRINPAFNGLRPAPVYDQSVYHYLCHSRKGKLRTQILLDGVQPAAIFSDILANRHLGMGDSRQLGIA